MKNKYRSYWKIKAGTAILVSEQIAFNVKKELRIPRTASRPLLWVLKPTPAKKPLLCKWYKLCQPR